MGSKGQFRDQVTGQYAYFNDWGRLCVCGHTLGIHVAGGFDCLNGETGLACDGATGEACSCVKFRQSRKKSVPFPPAAQPDDAAPAPMAGREGR